jgi:enhancer of polycomb-like protein
LWGDVKVERTDVSQYDESNDNDPYVCFRRRDIRATRKTRRTDTISVERMQRLQHELRSAQSLATLVLRRETEKLALVKADMGVWEAKWKLFETKRRWPSLGMTKEEEEIITGRQGASVNGFAGMRDSLGLANLANGRRKGDGQGERDRDKDRDRERERERERDKERDRRERLGELGRNGLGRDIVMTGIGSKSMAPEAIKERLAAVQQRIDEETAKKKEADIGWDDATDVSIVFLHESMPRLFCL